VREAHCHVASFGEALTLPNLDQAESVGACLDLVRQEAARAGGGWVRIKGARVEGWRERRWPTREELDRAAGATPCVIMSFDHHAAAANSAAMTRAGVRAGEPVPPNGVVVVDERTGEASGLLLEQAAYAVWSAAPEPTPAQREGFVIAALERYRALGFVEVHDLLSQDWLGPLAGRLEREGRLPVERVVLYPPIDRLSEVHAGRVGWESEHVVLAGGKVFVDGTLNSRTALLLRAYADPLPGMECGKAMLSRADLDAALALTESLGLHLAAHAIGDGAVRMVLDAIGRRPRRNARHRIEHCEIIDAADVPQFAELGVVCSVQPCHLLTDIEVLESQLPDRLDRVLPLRELIDAGCEPGERLWFGSDAPIVRPEAEDSVQGAVERRRAGMSEKSALAASQAISADEAWRCFGRAPGTPSDARNPGERGWP
jgi:predicted amidohydrolase YtcJ